MRQTPPIYLAGHDPVRLDELEAQLAGRGYGVHRVGLEVAPAGETGACLVIVLEGGRPFSRWEVATRIPTVFVLDDDDTAGAVRAMKQGAVDVVSHTAEPQDVDRSVRRAFDAGARRQHLESHLRDVCERHALLTERERTVFQGVVAGRLNKQIAAEMGVVEKTVKLHRGHLMQKMGAESVPDLVRMARQVAALESSEAART